MEGVTSHAPYISAAVDTDFDSAT